MTQYAECLWCGQEVEDGHEVSGYVSGPDWMIDGDFGCERNPLTSEEGTGGHQTLHEVEDEMRMLNAIRELVITPAVLGVKVSA